MARARPPPEGPGLPWVARTERIVSQRGSRNYGENPKTRQAGRLRYEEDLRGSSVPQASRLPCLLPGAPISDAPLGQEVFWGAQPRAGLALWAAAWPGLYADVPLGQQRQNHMTEGHSCCSQAFLKAHSGAIALGNRRKKTPALTARRMFHGIARLFDGPPGLW